MNSADLIEGMRLVGLSAPKLAEDLPTVAPELLTEKMKMASAKVFVAAGGDIDGVKGTVYAIKNDSEAVAGLVALLGVPEDGTPYKIRTGFMVYDTAQKMLFFAKAKSDLPAVRK